MNGQKFRSFSAAALLVTAMALPVLGCFGGGDEPTVTTMSLAVNEETIPVATTTSVVGDISAQVANEDLSTFKSKDPFIPQALLTTTTTKVPATTTTKAATTTTTTKAGATTTTTRATTTTTRATTTTTQPSTTTTQPTTTTTMSPYLHTMTVLSIANVGGSPAVTFRVDSMTYTSKFVGNVVSTTWGEVQVLAVDVSGQVATFLHGSETVTLAVGVVIHE